MAGSDSVTTRIVTPLPLGKQLLPRTCLLLCSLLPSGVEVKPHLWKGEEWRGKVPLLTYLVIQTVFYHFFNYNERLS